MHTEKPKIILDTDPGGDDCFALLWLLSLVKQNYAELVAVTSVDGNVHAQLTFAAAGKLLQLCGFDAIEVGRGVIGGSASPIEDASGIHGADGMGNLSHTLPDLPRRYEEARLSDDLLIDQLSRFPGEITLIAIGPLTNLAAAETKAPGILNQAKEIIIMGGAFRVPGNITPEAEFNIVYDVEAAKLVFDRCTNLVIIPLDVTRQLIYTPDRVEQVAATNPDSAIGQFAVRLCHFMADTSLTCRETGGKRGFLVHDAATLAYLFYPETLLFRRALVEIETQGQWTTGKTVMDHRHKTKRGAKVWVGMEVDSHNVLAALSEDLKILIR